jgi:mevalonate kinase
MTENQHFLKTLGVSTARIDGLTAALSGFVHGVKITGAGGGGCVVCLPKDGMEGPIAEAARKSGCEVLPVALSKEGTRRIEPEAACRP